MKTINEQAKGIVHQWIEHDLDETLHSEYVASLQPELLQERIADALTAVAREQREVDAKLSAEIEQAATVNREIMSRQKSFTAVEQCIGAAVAARECAAAIRAAKVGG